MEAGSRAMLFRVAGMELGQALATPGSPLHLAGHLRAEGWNGTVSVIFVVTDAAS